MRIAIYGAYGFSGQLIGETLVAAGFHPILAGRDAAKLQALNNAWSTSLEKKIINAENAADINHFLSGIDLLIQTAGPYSILPDTFIQTLAHWSGIVLDVCGEYSFIEDSILHREEIIKKSGGLHVPACGFESFPALWLTEKLLGDWQASRVCTFYSHTNPKFSPGTRSSAQIISSMGKKIFADGSLRDATKEEWIDSSIVPHGFPGDSALLSPLPEIVLIPRKYAVKNCGSYALVPEEAARFLKTGTAGETSKQVNFSRRPRSIPNATEREKHAFKVTVKAWNENGESRSAQLQGRDPYGTTAWLIRRMVQILEKSKTRPVGICSSEEIFPAEIGLQEVIDAFGFKLE